MAVPFELGLIILFSIIGGVLAVRFRQPAVLGLLIVGAIVGPYTLGFITDRGAIDTAIEIGAILLMFTIGIEFSVPRLLSLGMRVVLITAGKIGITFLATYYVSILLGFSTIISLYIGVILSITSTVILIKILEQKGFASRHEMPMLVAILILEDLFGVFALTFFSGFESSSDLIPLNLLSGIVVSLTVLVVTYLILRRILRPVISWLIKYSAEDTFAFTALGLCGGMSYLAYLLHLSPSVGAFLAGNIIAALPRAKAFEKAIHPFTLTFTSLFFFSIGTAVDFRAIVAFFPLILLLTLAFVCASLISIGFGTYLIMNFSGSAAVFSALAMIPRGEFSLLIAKEATAVSLGVDLVSITAAIILLSSLIMSICIGRYEQIYNFISRQLPQGAARNIRAVPRFFNAISQYRVTDNTIVKRIIEDRRKIFVNFSILFFGLIGVYWIWKFFGQELAIFNSEYLSYVIIGIIVIAALFPISGIFKNSFLLFHDILKLFIKHSSNGLSQEKKVLRNLVTLGSIFFVMIIYALLFVFFNIPRQYHWISLILLAILCVVIVHASRLMKKLMKNGILKK